METKLTKNIMKTKTSNQVEVKSGSVNLILGDCLKELKKILDNSIDSIVTDSPYELGFMGKEWDKTEIAYNVDMWKECYRVLKPGGHILSFGGSRTYHRMACAIEDAGFEIRDMIEWVYGSGFPKSLNVGKAIDAKNKTGKSGTMQLRQVEQEGNGKPYTLKGKNNRILGEERIYERKEYKCENEWDGWGTALKPAHEPICLARKPLSEKTVAQNVLKYRTGGINIDACRIELNGDIKLGGFGNGKIGFGGGDAKNVIWQHNTQGRFPANFIHDGSDEVVSLFPNTKSGKMTSDMKRHTNGSPNGIYGKFNPNHPLSETYGDEGSAARFFYCPKVSKSERQGSSHPTMKPIKLIEYLIKLITPPNGIVLDPFMGSGTTGVAAKKLGFNFIGIEKEAEYMEIAKYRIHEIKKNIINKKLKRILENAA